jgi:dTDP-4-dehydrorhamnose 3,5-epimerase
VIFEGLRLGGAFLVELEKQEDERGFFSRTFCEEEFRANGLCTFVAQCNLSYNARRGTLRGLHFQRPPAAEAKVVRCGRGAIFDVMVDLRVDSPTHREWEAVNLTADGSRMLYIPEGCAHGFVTLTDDTEVVYQMSVPYQPELGGGVRWDDPAFGIRWPSVGDLLINDRDRGFPDYR